MQRRNIFKFVSLLLDQEFVFAFFAVTYLRRQKFEPFLEARLWECPRVYLALSVERAAYNSYILELRHKRTHLGANRPLDSACYAASHLFWVYGKEEASAEVGYESKIHRLFAGIVQRQKIPALFFRSRSCGHLMAARNRMRTVYNSLVPVRS